MPDPLALVIFGATGDLARRKLVPALYSLATSNLLPEKLAVVGFGRSQRDEDEFRQGLRDALVAAGLRPRDDVWTRFAGHITYMSGGYDDAASFRRLAETLDDLDQTAGTANHRLFYLAIPPTTYVDVVRNLGMSGLNVPQKEGGWARVIVEKPFGRDLETARALRRDERYADLPILMMATERVKDSIDAALAAGANEYLMKPFTRDVIGPRRLLRGGRRHPRHAAEPHAAAARAHGDGAAQFLHAR